MTLDFRSDTVTKPTKGMRDAMYRAEVGDDVTRDDPTVNKLEETMADRFGKQAGLFVTSGTQGNLLALLTHCARGDEYIVGQTAHTYKYEGGGGAALGGIQPQPVDFSRDGTIDLDLATSVIKPDDYHFAKTRLFCLENTNFGKALPLEYLKRSRKFVADNGLAYHLDGARVFNAAAKCGVDVAEITKPFDTISSCFSKGLGAPVGSILCGEETAIASARRWRKLLGGGMRQAGVIAAAALYAIENHVQRLAEDHENAEWLANELSSVDEITVTYEPMQTNMVFVGIDPRSLPKLKGYMTSKDIKLDYGETIRLVTHLDVDRAAVATLAGEIKNFFSRGS